MILALLGCPKPWIKDHCVPTMHLELVGLLHILVAEDDGGVVGALGPLQLTS